MILPIIKDDIIGRIIVLVALFVVTFVGLHFGQNMLHQRQQYLSQLLNNENVRIELVHITQKKALAMNMKFAIMGNSTSVTELNFNRIKILAIKNALEKIINILDQGGKISISNLKNINSASSYIIVKTYNKYGTDRINPVILEFKARLSALTAVVDQLRVIVEEKLRVVEEKSISQTLREILKLENFQKISLPLFTSILNDSRMLLEQSYQEMERLNKIDQKFNNTYKQFEMILKTVFFGGFLLTAGLVLQSSRKILLQGSQAQLKLDKSERHYRRLIENMSDIISIVDIHGKISYVSPSVEKVLGIPSENLIGSNIRDLIRADEIENTDLEVLYDLQQAEDSLLEYHAMGVNGDHRTLEVHIKKFKHDDNSDGYLFTGRDVTLRKRAEEERYKLQMVIEQAPICVVITDTEGNIEYVNPAFQQLSEYSYAEVLGGNPRILKSEETPPERFTELWETITSGKIWSGEIVNKKKSGELYTESIIVVPIKNSKGDITRYAAITEDITELIFEKDRAECANRAKSKFLSQMSHELRTPLNAINGFSQLMLKSKKDPLTEKQRSMAQQINTAGEHLLQLINDVLDLARIESGEIVLSMQSMDPQLSIVDCLALIRPLADEKGITVINQRCGETLPEVVADVTKFKQILLNLLSNAVKYNHPEGSVNIDVEISIPGFLRFSVKDDGIGIAADKQMDIFVPFTRAVDNPDVIEGTGIGMTITKQLVAEHGGEIGFTSVYGEGSTFWFTLPLAVTDGSDRL